MKRPKFANSFLVDRRDGLDFEFSLRIYRRSSEALLFFFFFYLFREKASFLGEEAYTTNIRQIL